MRFLSLAVLATLAGVPLAQAVDFPFDGSTYPVEYITGSGSSKAMLVLDFGTLNYQFGYQWDGSPRTSGQMLDDIAAAGAVDVTAFEQGTPNAFTTGITYAGQGELYDPTQPSTGYPNNWYFFYIGDNPVAWRASDLGEGTNPLLDGEWNLWTWQTDESGSNLPGPVPEPASLAILGVGAIGLMRRRANRSVRSSGLSL